MTCKWSCAKSCHPFAQFRLQPVLCALNTAQELCLLTWKEKKKKKTKRRRGGEQREGEGGEGEGKRKGKGKGATKYGVFISSLVYTTCLSWHSACGWFLGQVLQISLFYYTCWIDRWLLFSLTKLSRTIYFTNLYHSVVDECLAMFSEWRFTL